MPSPFACAGILAFACTVHLSAATVELDPKLPAYAKVDATGKPTTRVDFSEPVDGMEAPWGMAQLTFYADRARVAQPPASWAELLDWARRNPGRFTYPKPPAFHGTTFLKQLLDLLKKAF